MNIPAQYRVAFYWLTAIVAAGVTIAAGLDVIPPDAVERGVMAGGLILGLLSSVLALFNITPE